MKIPAWTRLAVAILCIGCSKTPKDAPPSAVGIPTEQTQFQSIKKQYEIAEKESDEGKIDEWVTKALEFGKANSNGQEGMDALLWITQQDRRCIYFKNANDQAMRHLLDHHANHPDVATAVFEMRKSRSPQTIETMTGLLDSENDTLRGFALFGLGSRFRYRKDKTQAIEYLERVIREHPDLLAFENPKTYVRELAERCLREIRQLQIGMVAPDIEGTDLKGAPLRLSDYRGKVVLLSFWADW